MDIENKLIAEWIPYTNRYRLYDARKPHQTIAYEDDLDTAEKEAVFNGYSGIITENDWNKYRIIKLSKILSSVCRYYEDDCSKCPNNKECEEYAHIPQGGTKA